MGMHVRAALRNGLSRDEIAEVLLHTAVYAGVPAANAASAVAAETLAELDQEFWMTDARDPYGPPPWPVSPLARWLRLPCLWRPAFLAAGRWPLLVWRLRTARLGHGRHHLRSHPHPADGLVRGRLAPHLAEERDLRPRAPTVLGLGSYQTAWAMLHRYRTAMVRPGSDRLSGEVEVDESAVGGRRRGRRGRGAEGNTLVGAGPRRFRSRCPGHRPPRASGARRRAAPLAPGPRIRSGSGGPDRHPPVRAREALRASGSMMSGAVSTAAESSSGRAA